MNKLFHTVAGLTKAMAFRAGALVCLKKLLDRQRLLQTVSIVFDNTGRITQGDGRFWDDQWLRSMEPAMGKCTLVVEDCVVTALAVTRVIERIWPQHRILRAQSCYEAELLMCGYEFSLFILDIHLPDGSGVDLAASIIQKDPGAAIIVLTADPLPEHQERCVALGARQFLHKPFRPSILRDAVRHCLAAEGQSGSDYDFTALLRRVSVLDIIQLKCIGRSNTCLDISDGRCRSAAIYIQNGQIVHAEVRDPDLNLLAAGRSAIREILGWRGGSVEEITPQPAAQRTIVEPWESLLLEAAQQCDEEADSRVSVP